eukprot:GHVS01079119.1.p1 GENE.GHVS01079119.1~~GHVS01079119.1.p1  ORF type:complete len:189 (-),score=41.39 GHVS01079119.1:830-1396(-)
MTKGSEAPSDSLWYGGGALAVEATASGSNCQWKQLPVEATDSGSSGSNCHCCRCCPSRRRCCFQKYPWNRCLTPAFRDRTGTRISVVTIQVFSIIMPQMPSFEHLHLGLPPTSVVAAATEDNEAAAVLAATAFTAATAASGSCGWQQVEAANVAAVVATGKGERRKELPYAACELPYAAHKEEAGEGR